MTVEQNTPHSPTGETPLQGWKEIATYLDRDQRTARRWESEEGLPVRRHRTDRRSSVYAYASEIESWRANRPPQSGTHEPPPPVHASSHAGILSAVAAVLVVGLVLFLLSTRLDPVAEAGSDEGIRTTEVYAHAIVGELSPDGRYLSETDWVSSGEIGIRDLETGEYRRLGDKSKWSEGVGEADRSIFSPDGQQIAYNWATDRSGEYRYELRVVGAFDGGPKSRSVYFNPEFRYIEPNAWTQDDRLLVWFQRSDWSVGLGFVSLETGELSVVKSLTGEVSAATLSHDARWIVYSAPSSVDGPNHEIHLLASDGSAEKNVAPHRANDVAMGFTPDNKTLLFASDRTGTYGLWGQQLDDDGPVGSPRILMRDIGSVVPMGVLPDGALIYGRAMGAVDIQTAELDLATGRVLAEPHIVETQYQGSNDGPWLSPDASQLAYFASPGLTMGSRAARKRLMIRDLESERERQVPVEGLRLGSYHGIAWSPEGERILATARDEQGRWSLVEVELETGITRELVSGAEFALRPIGWMADGKTALYFYLSNESAEGLSEKAIYKIEAGQAEGQPVYVSQGKASVGKILSAILSPQRDRIAWRELTLPETVKVMSVDGGDARIVYQNQPDEQRWTLSIAWAPDGKSLLLLRSPWGQPKARDIWTLPLSGGEPQKTLLTVPFSKNLSMHPDGKTVFFRAGAKDIRIFRTENYLPVTDAPAK